MSRVNVKFTGDTSNLKSAITGVKTGVRGIGGAIKSAFLPLAAVGAAIGGIGAMFKGIGLAAELETVGVKFETILGSTEKANKLLQNLRDTAKATPYEFNQITKAADQLIVKFGGGDDMIQRLREIGDVASGSGNDIGELAKIYAQVASTDRVDQEKVNQLAERGIPIYKELSNVLGIAETGLRDMVSSGKVGFKELDQVFKNLTNEGGMFFKSMEKQSLTWNGLVSTLKSNVDDMLASFAQPILQELKPLLNDSINLSAELGERAKKAGAAVANVVRWMVAVFRNGEIGTLLKNSLLVGAKEFGNFMYKVLSGIGALLGNQVAKLKAGFEIVMTVLKNGFAIIGLKVQKLLMDANAAAYIIANPTSLLVKGSNPFEYVSKSLDQQINALETNGAKAMFEAFQKFASAQLGDLAAFADGFKNAGVFFDTSENIAALKALGKSVQDQTTATKDNTKAKVNEAVKAAGPTQAEIDAFAKFSEAKGERQREVVDYFSGLLKNVRTFALPDIARVGGAVGITDNIAANTQRQTNEILNKQTRILEQIRDAKTQGKLVAVLA